MTKLVRQPSCPFIVEAFGVYASCCYARRNRKHSYTSESASSIHVRPELKSATECREDVHEGMLGSLHFIRMYRVLTTTGIQNGDIHIKTA